MLTVSSVFQGNKRFFYVTARAFLFISLTCRTSQCYAMQTFDSARLPQVGHLTSQQYRRFASPVRCAETFLLSIATFRFLQFARSLVSYSTADLAGSTITGHIGLFDVASCSPFSMCSEHAISHTDRPHARTSLLCFIRLNYVFEAATTPSLIKTYTR